MTTSRSALALVTALLALPGCGLKGPLYQAPPEPAPDAAEATDADAVNEPNESDQPENDDNG